jgi:spore germination cell wall hydrolase CwlJ-like protein
METTVLAMLISVSLAMPLPQRVEIQQPWVNWASPVKVDARQIECMAKAIYFEAGNEPDEGKIAVGKVILNRIASGKYPTDVCSVVYQKNYRAAGCQFTFACERNPRIASRQRYEEAHYWAEQVMAGFHKDNTNGATSFNNVPFKDRRLVKTAQIGHHHFYRNKVLTVQMGSLYNG